MAYRAVRAIGDGVAMNTVTPTLGVRVAAFPPGVLPLQGDSVLIVATGETYLVRDAEPDGHGHCKLLLEYSQG